MLSSYANSKRRFSNFVSFSRPKASKYMKVTHLCYKHYLFSIVYYARRKLPEIGSVVAFSNLYFHAIFAVAYFIE